VVVRFVGGGNRSTWRKPHFHVAAVKIGTHFNL
jgi:hypothetical protein